MYPDSDTLVMRVQACAEARVALMVTKGDEDGDLYQIVFGAANNTQITFGYVSLFVRKHFKSMIDILILNN